MEKIIPAKEAETLKTVVGILSKKVDNLTVVVNDVATAQKKLETSLQELITARRTGPSIQLMKADAVQQAIRDNTPVASIGKQSKEKIDALILATEDLVKSNKAANLAIHTIKKVTWVVTGVLCLLGMIAAVIGLKI